MPKFIFVYRDPMGYDARSDPDGIAAWAAFLEDKIRPNVLDPGWPVFEEATVVGKSGLPTRLAGYSVIDVKDLAAAVALTDTCPTLGHGGSVEVGTLGELPPGHPAEIMRRQLLEAQ
jgi:hypothetical protein